MAPQRVKSRVVSISQPEHTGVNVYRFGRGNSAKKTETPPKTEAQCPGCWRGLASSEKWCDLGQDVLARVRRQRVQISKRMACPARVIVARRTFALKVRFFFGARLAHAAETLLEIVRP